MARLHVLPFSCVRTSVCPEPRVPHCVDSARNFLRHFRVRDGLRSAGGRRDEHDRLREPQAVGGGAASHFSWARRPVRRIVERAVLALVRPRTHESFIQVILRVETD